MQLQVLKPQQRFSFAPIFLLIAVLVGIGVYLLYFIPKTIGPQKLNSEERNYYQALYRDTWYYLANHVEPKTGLPFDSSAQQPPTSMSNVGLYLASTAIASRTGLISKEEGLLRTEKVLDSLEQMETWRGFPRPWVLVRTGKPTHGEEFNYGPHIATLVGGLIVSKATFGTVVPRIEKLLSRMEFKSLYDSQSEWLKGGYNVKTNNFAVFQPWGHWYYKYFAADTRLLSFYLVARKAAPKKHWFALIRPTEQKEGETFYALPQPNSGLAPQYLAGLFLDERATQMGGSQKNLAKAQMKSAKKMGAPVWGWSPSQAPNGRYLVEGELRDEIVAPYASILTVIYFPKQVYENLKRLESLSVRPQLPQPQNFGFVDSVNWKTGTVAKNYMTPSQGMAFLSLANLLYDGIVWKSFSEDFVVKQGLEIL